MTRDIEIISESTAVVIPAFNAGRHLGGVLHDTARFIPETRIIVVDDGSDDNTQEIARKAGYLNVSYGTFECKHFRFRPWWQLEHFTIFPAS